MDQTCVPATYLPDESTSGVLSPFTSPVSPPKPICRSKSLRLHDLRIVDITILIVELMQMPES